MKICLFMKEFLEIYSMISPIFEAIFHLCFLGLMGRKFRFYFYELLYIRSDFRAFFRGFGYFGSYLPYFW
jgi:hypothetical protein